MDIFKLTLWTSITQCIVLSLLVTLFNLAQSVYHPKIPVTATHVHKHLYVDRNVDIFYEVQIKEAAKRWTAATNHLAEFEEEYITEENRFNLLDDKDAIVVTMVTEDHPDIINADRGQETGHYTVAYCNTKAKTPILAYVEVRIPDGDFEKITLHELGHALELEHVDTPKRIMYPTADLMPDFLGREDMEQFCQVYHCDPNKLQYEKETLHP